MNQTQQERILGVLQALQTPEHKIPEQYLKRLPYGDAVSARYFKQVLLISECNGRISELRGKGHQIETTQEKDPYGFAYHRLRPEEAESRPRIRILGDDGEEDVPWDSVDDPEPKLEDHFKPVRIMPRALDIASKIIPREFWKDEKGNACGLHEFLQRCADGAFPKMSASQREIAWGKLRYSFDFDKDGPLLKTISLI